MSVPIDAYIARAALPVAVLILVLIGWEALVRRTTGLKARRETPASSGRTGGGRGGEMRHDVRGGSCSTDL